MRRTRNGLHWLTAICLAWPAWLCAAPPQIDLSQTDLGKAASSLKMLDDQALNQVHGVDVDLAFVLDKNSQQRQSSTLLQLRRDTTTLRKVQDTALLLAMLEHQYLQAAQMSAAARASVIGGAQLGRTMVSLTPVAITAPLGLSLPMLPATTITPR